MRSRRGTTISVAHSLGHVATSTLATNRLDAVDPSDSGFVTRWPDDLALLADVGITEVRLSFDWARLQPRPGDLSEEWVEWYGDVVGAARAVGLATWACLLDADGGVPRWLDNEGGIGDAETVVRWWPRWLERVADEFGDRIDGWIPAVHASPDLPTQAWRDTWALLRGEAPVTLSLRPRDLARAEDLRGAYDGIGVVIEMSDDPIDDLDERLRLDGDRWAEQLGRAAEISDDRPIVSDLALDDHDPALAEPALARLLQIAESSDTSADDDGASDAAEVVFVGPMVATHAGDDGAESTGLFDAHRAMRPEGATYLDVAES
ncbi:MAG: family 1 glycosylhydrolase [Actinomycetota bacterium]